MNTSTSYRGSGLPFSAPGAVRPADDDSVVIEIKSKLQRDICDIWAWLDTIYPSALFIVGVSWHHSSGRECVVRIAPVTFSKEDRLQLKASFEEGPDGFRLARSTVRLPTKPQLCNRPRVSFCTREDVAPPTGQNSAGKAQCPDQSGAIDVIGSVLRRPTNPPDDNGCLPLPDSVYAQCAAAMLIAGRSPPSPANASCLQERTMIC